MRQFGDLDIVVSRRDVWKATSLLVSEGYRPMPDLSADQVDHWLAHQSAYGFRREHSSVDLTWANPKVPSAITFDPAEIASTANGMAYHSLGGSQVACLSPPTLLLYLCEHGTKHLWFRLKWLCDVAELLRTTPGLDWDRLLETARMTGRLRMFLVSMSLASELFGTPLPEAVWRMIQSDPLVTTLTKRLITRLFLVRDQPPGIWEGIRFFFDIRERWGDRLRFGWLALKLSPRPTLRDRAWVVLPRPLWFLYFPLRPVRVVSAYYSPQSWLASKTARAERKNL